MSSSASTGGLLSLSLKHVSRRIVPHISLPRQSSKSEHNVSVPASKASVIRIICGQIFQELYDASDALNDEHLQQLSAELTKYSQDAIKRKSARRRSSKEDSSSKKHSFPRMLSDEGSLQKAINERMANVVEKEENIRMPLRSIHEVEQISSKRRKGSRSALYLITKLPDEDGGYDVFLNISDQNLMTDSQQLRRDYVAFKRSDSNVLFMLFCILLAILAMGTGIVWSSDINTYREYPTATMSVIFAVLTVVSLSWVTLNRIALLSFRYNIVCLQWYHKYVTKLYELSYGQWPDNSTNICAALAAGFYLVNIVLMNICNPEMEVHVGMNNHHACDSFSGPPPESFVFTMVIVLLLQIAARGVSRMALVCSWIICFIAINMTIYLSGSGSYVWMNVLQALIMFVSYELERQPLRQFIKTARAIEAGEMNAKLRVRLAAYETLQAAEALKAKCSLVRSQS